MHEILDFECMNRALGGGHGWEHVNADPKMQAIRSANGRATGAMNGSATLCKLWQADRQTMIQSSMIGGQAGGAIARFEVARTFAHTPEAREKRLASYKSIGHQQGAANSRAGTCWIMKDGQSKSVKIDEVETYLADGWVKGRICKRKHLAV